MTTSAFGACPQCTQRMRIESLHCWHCGTSVSGRISIPLLATLPDVQARFVERFLAANGSLSQAQKEMGVSYHALQQRIGRGWGDRAFTVPFATQ